MDFDNNPNNSEVVDSNEGFNSHFKQQRKLKEGNLSFARIFGYMFAGILITAVVALGLAYAFKGLNNNTLNAITIVAAIVQLVLSIVITFVVLKGEHSIIGPALLFCLTVGFLFGALFALIAKLYPINGWAMIGMAFGITAGTFLIMTLIAVLSKGNMSGLAIAGMGLFIGAGLISMVNLILMFCAPAAFHWSFWVADFCIFGAIMLITIFDIWNIKKITEAGMMSRQMEFYCAFSMYNDFIALFIRILYYIIIFSSHNN